MDSEAGKTARRWDARRVAAVSSVFLFFLLALVALWQWGVRADGDTRSTLLLTSSSFSNENAIPARFTCDGADVSPGLAWRGAPAATRSFALVAHDPDAPVDFTHWLVYGIPVGVSSLAEGASTNDAMPRGSEEGINGFHSVGYAGPCPPPGTPHHYVFQAYALDASIHLPPGATREQLDAAMRGHILAEGRIVGVYQRKLFGMRR